MKLIFNQVRSHYDRGEYSASALPSFPAGGTQFGIVFPDRRTAAAFADGFRADPFPLHTARRSTGGAQGGTAAHG